MSNVIFTWEFSPESLFPYIFVSDKDLFKIWGNRGPRYFALFTGPINIWACFLGNLQNSCKFEEQVWNETGVAEADGSHDFLNNVMEAGCQKEEEETNNLEEEVNKHTTVDIDWL